ncbi:MAG: tetratricopeptide repeat protein, partial [Deltaproteobacteria bacterium]|nr:tetratricopeptide repeat protein [Deltaproteobacteria bacterium]
NPVEKILSSYAMRDFTLTQRVLTEFRVVIFYIGLLLFPHPSRLNLDRDFPLSHSLVDPATTLLSIGAIVGLFVLAVYLAKRERLLSFCILWFLVNLVIESSVYGLEIIFEHRTYLPSMLVCLMAVTLVYRYIKAKSLRAVVLCGVVVVLSFWTYERNEVWGDAVTLWRDCVKKSPNKARPHNNLGIALKEKGKADEAIVQYREAMRIKPTNAEARSNLGDILISLGRIEEGIAHCRESLRIKPDFAQPHYNWGRGLVNQGRLDEAIVHFYEALGIDPYYAEAHNNLGVVQFKKGRIEEAIAHYREALRLKPDYPLALKNLQITLAKQRKNRGEVAKRQVMRRHTSANAGLHYKLGNMYKAKGKLEEAIGEYQKALFIQPGFIPALNDLALAYISKREYDEALPLCMKMIELRPDNYVAYYNIACMYARQDKVEESVHWLKQAVERGFKDWEFLKKDKDLENIRNTSYFKGLIRGN